MTERNYALMHHMHIKLTQIQFYDLGQRKRGKRRSNSLKSAGNRRTSGNVNTDQCFLGAQLENLDQILYKSVWKKEICLKTWKANRAVKDYRVKSRQGKETQRGEPSTWEVFSLKQLLTLIWAAAKLGGWAEPVTDLGPQPESQGDLERARSEEHRKVNNMGSPNYYCVKLKIIAIIIMMTPSSSEA